MKLLDSIEVFYKNQKKYIELYQGDLTNLIPNEYFDVLIVSAFPNDYSPTRSSLIGALHKKGVSVSLLAQMKELDLRSIYSCWFSAELHPAEYSGIGFKRLLCFEPLIKGEPPYKLIGDIFQTLAPLTIQFGIKSVAMPLLATGDAMYPVTTILGPLIESSVNWLNLGLDLDKIKIVAYDEKKSQEAASIFKELKAKFSNFSIRVNTNFNFDYFISYSHNDSVLADYLHTKLKNKIPSLKIFFDRLELKPGFAWQQEIFEALDDCKKIITILSPGYLNSKVCKEEYNIALFRHRESNNILIPLYLYTCELPTYMKLIQHIDCREGEENKIDLAIETMIRN